MLNARLDRRPLTRDLQMATAGLLIVATLSIAGAAAQARYSTLSGTVVDQTNAFLPDTTLVLTNAASGARHEVKSDRTGRFEFVGLPSGEYTLQVAQPGFATLTEPIAIARDLARTIELQVGSLQETISIVGGPSDSRPDPNRIEKLQALRQKAQERQQRATERCEGPAARRSWRQHPPAVENCRCEAGLSRGRIEHPHRRRGDDGGVDRDGWNGAGGACGVVTASRSRSRGHRSSAAVGVHADDPELHADRGAHEGHREFRRASVAGPPRQRLPRNCSRMLPSGATRTVAVKMLDRPPR